MGILMGSGPLGSGPTGPGSGFSVMPILSEIILDLWVICLHASNKTTPYHRNLSYSSKRCVIICNRLLPLNNPFSLVQQDSSPCSV